VLFLYYWDERDGEHYQGWWIAPAVGSDQFMAFSNGDAASPELCRGWRGADRLLNLHVVLVDGTALVRDRGLGHLEGAYARAPSCPHDHGGRPVYRRERALDANEMSTIDRMLSEEEDASFSLVAMQVGDSASVLVWVQGAGEPAGEKVVAAATSAPVQWANIAGDDMIGTEATGVEAAATVLRRTVCIEQSSDLERSVTKAADEELSIPELHDAESPPPVGWVIVSRSTEDITRSVRGLLLHAADDLEGSAYRELPQVREQIQRLRQLAADGRGFSVCVWGSRTGGGS